MHISISAHGPLAQGHQKKNPPGRKRKRKEKNARKKQSRGVLEMVSFLVVIRRGNFQSIAVITQ